MAPKKGKNVLLMISNIGISSSDLNSLEEEPFIDKIKYAMKILVEKKIFLQPKDEIGIITMGDETNNPEDIDNVKLYCEHLLVPNWEMVKYIQNLASTDLSCNWIEALHVALCFIKREVMELASDVFVVIFNNFKEDSKMIEDYDSNIISNELKSYGLNILFVGENSLNENNTSEKFALDIMKLTGAQYEKIDNFIESKQFYLAPPVNTIPWRVNLEWAGLQIPCSTFIKVTESLKPSPWKIQGVVNDSEDNAGDLSKESQNFTNVIKEKVQIDVHRNEIDPENIINGYKFGGKYIPFTDEDEMAMHYSGGPKSLKVYGFVPQNQVKLEYWTGKGSRIVVPDSEENATVFFSLIKAMAENKYVAIVRKVYSNNNLPRMGVLFPKVKENEVSCLVHIELPFIHDVRVSDKGMVYVGEKIEDKEKIEAVENFIDSMTVNNEDLPYLNPGRFPNVKNQYHWNAVADRAINNLKKPLLPVNDYIKKYLGTPETLKNKAEPQLEKLNELFVALKIKNQVAKVQNSDISKDSNQVPNSEDVQNISNEPIKPSSINNLINFFSPDDVDLKMDELEDF